jgi:hypothetical protein
MEETYVPFCRCYACLKPTEGFAEVWELPRSSGLKRMKLCRSCGRLFRAMKHGTILEKRLTLKREMRKLPAVHKRVLQIQGVNRDSRLTTVTPY